MLSPQMHLNRLFICRICLVCKVLRADRLRPGNELLADTPKLHDCSRKAHIWPSVKYCAFAYLIRQALQAP